MREGILNRARIFSFNQKNRIINGFEAVKIFLKTVIETPGGRTLMLLAHLLHWSTKKCQSLKFHISLILGR